MKNFRKEQMKLAVLLEITDKGIKNSEIIKNAEKRLILDEAYNKFMQNGKQTIGNKELQFVLYYIKRDNLADVVSRGVYVENEATKAERSKAISNILAEIDTKKIESKEIMLNADTLKLVRNLGKTVEKAVSGKNKIVKNSLDDNKISSFPQQDEKSNANENKVVVSEGKDCRVDKKVTSSLLVEKAKDSEIKDTNINVKNNT